MSAPSFSLPVVPATGLPAGVAPALGKGAAAGALGGFEALLSAFFGAAGQADGANLLQGVGTAAPAAVAGQADPTGGSGQPHPVKGGQANGHFVGHAQVAAATAATAAVTGQPAAPAATTSPAETKDRLAAPPATDETAKPSDPATAPAADITLAALVTPPPPATPVPALDITAPATGSDGQAQVQAQPGAPATPPVGQDTLSQHSPPAWGRDKAPGEPAAPALANREERLNRSTPPAPPATAPAPEAAPVAATAPTALNAETAVAAAASTAPAALSADTAATAPPSERPAPAAPAKDKASVRAGRSELPEAAPTGAAPHKAGATPPPSADGALAQAAADRPSAADASAAEVRSEKPEVAAGADGATGPAQPAATANSAHTPAATATSGVRGSPETVANLAAQILKKLGSRTTRFDVQLAPDGLGRVDVRVEIGRDGQMSAAMSFDNPQAAAELKSRAAELQKALSQAGFDLSGGLSFDMAGDPGASGRHHFEQQAQGGGDGASFRGRAFQAALDTAGEAAQAAVSSALNLRRGVSSGVDVRI